MAKNKKVIDLKPKVDKISKQHLTELQSVVNNINGIQFNIGKIEAQKHGLLHNLTKVQDGVKVLQEKLVKEYGTFDVNLDDGTINWPKEGGDEK
tara:strand:+ start:842 stop:1123 length:282 start_codon:yes stop_codon:yes gene_type:complete